jgi:NAD(P)-dependent dehydrogenase (short-subunit alcohol dehydrogenase family)
LDSGLAGKNALITAGATGIGFGISEALAAEGVNLAIASKDLDPQNLEKLRATGVRVEATQCDVSQENQVIQMVRGALSAFGHIDLYVNNAAWTWHRPVTEVDTQSLLNTLQTNLFACVWACRELSRHMIQRRSGSILIIGSTAMLNPFYQESAYRISKASLPYYAEVLAIELAPFGIRVNTVIPGFHLTKLTQAGMSEESLKKILREIPLGRAGLPADVGAQAVLLLSDKLSGYTTGTSIVIDGGLHLRPLPFYSAEELLALNAAGTGTGEG